MHGAKELNMTKWGGIIKWSRNKSSTASCKYWFSSAEPANGDLLVCQYMEHDKYTYMYIYVV